MSKGRKILLPCLSPVIADGDGGCSYMNCGFHYNDLLCFRPFNETELAECVSKREQVNMSIDETLSQVLKTTDDVVIPRIFFQCKDAASIRRWMSANVFQFLKKCRVRLSTSRPGKTI